MMMNMHIDPDLKAKHLRDVHRGDADCLSLDPELQDILWEESAPLQEVYPDEFQRYLELFFKFNPRTPVHVRQQYGGGFNCQKGRRKDGSDYNRGCYPDMIARSLDLERWQHNHPKVKFPEYYWVAMRASKASLLKVVDFDNKNGVLGHYHTRHNARVVSRPLPILTVGHLQNVKRIYDAFPNRIWCVSSATLGLHIWQKLAHPQRLEEIESHDRRILKTIGLDKTEIHPMHGRALRRPFGQDYFTITQHGLLGDWRDQLEYFERIAQTPSFESIYKHLRYLVDTEWRRFLYNREPGKVRLSSDDPILQQLLKQKTYSAVRDRMLHELDQWAAGGFQLTSVPETDDSIDEAPALIEKAKKRSSERIPVSFNGKWIQHCRSWCLNGLPEDDSLFRVVSNLAIWFYFIEFHAMPENDRMDKITKLLNHFCQTKHNGFITRLNCGQNQEVVEHIERSIESGISNVDSKGMELFDRIRKKRESGGYSKVYLLEPLIHQSVESLSSSVVLTECCSVLGSRSVVESAETWMPELDETPLPTELSEAIQKFYKHNQLTMYKPTRRKIARFINYLRSKGGEARLSVKALKKLGFSNHDLRQHINHLKRMRLIVTEGYSAAAHISKRFRLTERAVEMFIRDGRE
jgi:hypothetical protein